MTDKKLLVSPTTGHKFPIGGCKVHKRKSDCPKFGASRVLSTAKLPSAVDLRRHMTPVERQELMNSCVGNAFAGAYEFLIKSRTQKHVDVSRLFIYYNSRIIDGQEEHDMEDGGTCIPSAIESLAKYGCCKENLFPYTSKNVNAKPPAECYAAASPYRVKQAVELEPRLDEMKACLAEGYPFVFGLQLFQSFHQAETNGGLVTTPNPQYESQSEVHGWHALLAVGYDDGKQWFIVRNSWGEDWGDHGYCYVPYDYMTDPECCADLHAIKSISEDSSDQTYNPIPNFNDFTIDNKPSNVIDDSYPYYPPYPNHDTYQDYSPYPNHDTYQDYSPYPNHNTYQDYSPYPNHNTYQDYPPYPTHDTYQDYLPYPNNNIYPYHHHPYYPDTDKKSSNDANNKFDYETYWSTDIYYYPTENWPDTSTNTTWPMEEPSKDSSQNNSRILPNDQSSKKCKILWIDEASESNGSVANYIKQTKNVEVEFFETFSQAENYLLANSTKIRVPGMFQIITRGYHRSENKNPLDLLQILNRLRLYKVPVLVFTQDKMGLLNHLNNQASSMNTNDWRQRLFVTNNSSELLQKLEENIQ